MVILYIKLILIIRFALLYLVHILQSLAVVLQLIFIKLVGGIKKQLFNYLEKHNIVLFLEIMDFWQLVMMKEQLLFIILEPGKFSKL